MLKIKEAELINIDENFDNAIEKAKKLYLEGTVFVYPTDTIYGFGANPFNEDAVHSVNEIKGRDQDKRYIFLVDDLQTLMKYVDVQSDKHLDFLRAIWPNPVSVVLNLNDKTREILNFETIAFRIPNHRFCLKLLSALKMPLISTSVNRSNQPSMLEYSVIMEEFNTEVDAIFYTEKKSFFEASTLINLTNSEPKLIREGRYKFEELMKKFK